MPTKMDEWTMALLALVGIILAILLGASFAVKISEMNRVLRRLDTEIERAEGKERQFWKRKRRHLLFINFVPFYKFFKRK